MRETQIDKIYIMKIEISSLHFENNQKYRNKFGEWKTLKSGDLMFLELGSLNHFGMDTIIGLDSTSINNISKVRNDISLLENMDVNERIVWFESNYPKIKLIYLDKSLLSNDSNSKVTKFGSFKLSWS